MGIVNDAVAYIDRVTTPGSDKYNHFQHWEVRVSAYRNAELDGFKQSPEVYWQLTKQMTALGMISATFWKDMAKGTMELAKDFFSSEISADEERTVARCLEFLVSHSSQVPLWAMECSVKDGFERIFGQRKKTS